MKNTLTAEILKRLTDECPFSSIFEDTETREEELFSYPRSKIGHIRADYDGYRWWNTVWPYHNELATMEMRREIDDTYDALTAKDALRDLAALRRFCVSHPDSRVGSSETEYSFYLERELCNYWLRLITRKGDYNLYLNAYRKEIAHEAD